MTIFSILFVIVVIDFVVVVVSVVLMVYEVVVESVVVGSFVVFVELLTKSGVTTKKTLKKINSHLVVSILVDITAGFDSSCLDSLSVKGLGISDFALLIFFVSAVVVLSVLTFVETVTLTEAKQALLAAAHFLSVQTFEQLDSSK